MVKCLHSSYTQLFVSELFFLNGLTYISISKTYIMPIRMVDDPNDQYDNSNENTGGGGGGGRLPGGGGGGIFQLLPLLFGLIKNPVGLLLVLGIGAFLYFKGGCSGGVLPGENNNSAFSLGGNLDPKEFQKAAIYEATDPSKTKLPEAVSLLRFAPDRKNQGQQGSCVAWSSAYAARTIIESSSTAVNPNQTAFSPSFLYNQIGLDGCQGSYIIRAMESLTKVGSVPYNAFPYNENDCSTQPPGQLKQAAGQYRMLGFTRLTDGDQVSKLDLYAIKEHLAKDAPVVIGMMVGGSFMQNMMGQDIWRPSDGDYNMMGFGGHAMCVIGYDDRKEGGAFQIMNSWGPEWGQNGIGWVKYKDFTHFTREAYGLDAMPKRGAGISQTLECAIGLVDAKSKQYIPLQSKGGNIFQTRATIAKGTTFKMEIKNSSECYIYVVGMETDGGSYVLFPYPDAANPGTTKFSPYCGITGYRLFPRVKSMQADDIGSKDMIAVIVSKDSLNVFRLNEVVNNNRNAGFAQAVNAAVKNDMAGGVTFNNTNSGTMYFKTGVGSKTAVACIVEINKQ